MPDPVSVQVKRLPHGNGLDLPRYATDGAAGMDIVSAETVTLQPGARHESGERRRRSARAEALSQRFEADRGQLLPLPVC